MNIISIKKISVLSVLIVVLFYSGCGREKIAAGSPEEVLVFVREKGNTETILDYYTDDTVSLLKKYMKLTGMKKETAVDILSIIPEEADYSISGKTVDKNDCFLNIVFSRHNTENGMGQVIPLKMIREDNSWKIDRSDDFKKLIESFEKKGAEEYLNRIR